MKCCSVQPISRYLESTPCSKSCAWMRSADVQQQNSFVPADGKLLLCSAQGCAKLGSLPCSFLAISPMLGMLGLEPALHCGKLLLCSLMRLWQQHKGLGLQSSHAAEPMARHIVHIMCLGSLSGDFNRS